LNFSLLVRIGLSQTTELLYRGAIAFEARKSQLRGTMNSLLQTVSHEKTPKGHSHPVSTEVLSEALAGVRCFADLKLYYRSTEGNVLDERSPSAQGGKVAGAAASALDGYREFLNCSWTPDEGWTLIVRSVASARKAEIRKECAQYALPALRKWLEEPRPDSWFIGEHHMQIGMSEFTDEVALRELHDHHIVRQEEFLHDEKE
jgi:hypothetical protein